MRSEAALDRLVGFLTELDAEMRDEAVKALGAIGSKGLEAVEKAVEEGTLNRRAADQVLVRFYEEEVVRLFEKLISDRGGTGYYEGRFRELRDVGVEKAVPVLLQIARNEVTPEMFRNRPGAVYREQRREVAIMALGDLGDASLIDPLRKLLGEASGASVSTHAEIVLALHKLGDKKPLEEFLAKIRARAEECLKGDLKAEGCRHLFSEALLLGRVGKRDEAVAVYRRLLKEAKRPGVDAAEALVGEAHYNLACLSARSGKKEEAIGQLREAVRSGFKDRDWILRDKDLDPLRAEEGYKKLIADEELFRP
jgi:HEAT repeat protein